MTQPFTLEQAEVFLDTERVWNCFSFFHFSWGRAGEVALEDGGMRSSSDLNFRDKGISTRTFFVHRNGFAYEVRVQIEPVTRPADSTQR